MEGRGRCDRAQAQHGRRDPLSSPHHRRPLSTKESRLPHLRRPRVEATIHSAPCRIFLLPIRASDLAWRHADLGVSLEAAAAAGTGADGALGDAGALGLRCSLPRPSSDAPPTLAPMWDLRWRAPHRRGTSAGEPTRSIISLSESLFRLAQRRTRSWRRVRLEHLYPLQASMMEGGDSTTMAQFAIRVTRDDDALECPSVASSFITATRSQR